MKGKIHNVQYLMKNYQALDTTISSLPSWKLDHYELIDMKILSLDGKKLTIGFKLWKGQLNFSYTPSIPKITRNAKQQKCVNQNEKISNKSQCKTDRTVT